MKLVRILSSLAGAGIVVALTMALVLPAQEPPANPPAESPPAEQPAQEDEMRELGAEPSMPEPTGDAPEAPEAPEAPPVTVDEIIEEVVEAIAEEVGEEIQVKIENGSEDESSLPGVKISHGGGGNEMVRFGSNALLAEGETAREVVAILGDAVVDGKAGREVVAIMGNVTINGSSGREVVAIMGNAVINGPVGGEVVAIMGNVQLGPAAVVEGDIVCVGGVVDRAPGAVVKGATNNVELPFAGAALGDGVRAWVQECLLKLRPLAFGEHLGWLWGIMLAALGFYCLLALMLPSVVKRTAETMENYPGMSLLSALLTLVITPIAMIVLSVTVVGPFVLGLILFFIGIFGKVVFLAWLGRRITEPAGWKFPALAVLIGGVITLAIYLVPILGFIFQKLGGFLGTGIVVYTIVLALQDNDSSPSTPAAPVTPTGTVPPPTGAPASGAALGAQAGVSSMGGSVVSDAAATPSAATMPPGIPPASSAEIPPIPPTGAVAEPPEQLSTLPRAGFWARFAATFIDIIALGIAVGILDISDYFPVIATGYFIALWALKGTTLGGVVLGIKIVRVDDKPVDWSVALVRSLGAFLSLCLVGLGFIWVAWDPRRQSWHDKIAGTTIVKMPKGVSLI